jgi:chemotaxis protein MotB
MARKKRQEDHLNHEAWAIPYGDLITLLLAFFVVMYAISSVNEGKYRVLSDSMVAAFRTPNRSMEPIQIGEPSRSPSRSQSPAGDAGSPIDLNLMFPPPEFPELEQQQQASEPPMPHETAEIDADRLSEQEREMASMADQIEQAVTPLMDEDLIDVTRNELWVEVEINTSLLFSSGSATPSPQALPVLQQLAAILSPMPNRIHVEGFTDNLPISTSVYPSNWELSAARAGSVVRLFELYGVDPSRMAAIGFGEHRPRAANDTPAGRAQNRRVVLVILAGNGADRAEQGLPELLREDLQPAPRTGGGA